MNGYFTTAVDVIIAAIGAGSIFLLFLGERVANWLRNRGEES